jgi:hypothetical protein
MIMIGNNQISYCMDTVIQKTDNNTQHGITQPDQIHQERMAAIIPMIRDIINTKTKQIYAKEMLSRLKDIINTQKKDLSEAEKVMLLISVVNTLMENKTPGSVDKR